MWIIPFARLWSLCSQWNTILTWTLLVKLILRGLHTINNIVNICRLGLGLVSIYAPYWNVEIEDWRIFGWYKHYVVEAQYLKSFWKILNNRKDLIYGTGKDIYRMSARSLIVSLALYWYPVVNKNRLIMHICIITYACICIYLRIIVYHILFIRHQRQQIYCVSLVT